MLETIVSLGVGFFAARMARGFVRSPAAWGVGTVAVAFAIHRLAEVITLALDLHPVADAPGTNLIKMAVPFSGTMAVFVLAPLILPRLLPTVPLHLRNQPDIAVSIARAKAKAEERRQG